MAGTSKGGPKAAGSAAAGPGAAGRSGERSCGACRACCRVFEIPDFDKPRNVLCPHADRTGGERGCGIYASRPGACRAFECAWKQGLGNEDDRPDRIGVMFYLIPLTDGHPGLGVVEVRPGAFETARARRLIRGFQSRKPGRILVRRAEDDRFRPAAVLIEGKPLVGGGQRA